MSQTLHSCAGITKANVGGFCFFAAFFVQAPFFANAGEKNSLLKESFRALSAQHAGQPVRIWNSLIKKGLIKRWDLKTLLSLETEQGENLIHLFARSSFGYDEQKLLLAMGEDTEDFRYIYKAMAHRNRNNQTPYDVARDALNRLSLFYLERKLQEKLFYGGAETLFSGISFTALSALLVSVGYHLDGSSSTPDLAETTLLIGAAGLGYAGRLCFKAFKNLSTARNLKERIQQGLPSHL